MNFEDLRVGQTGTYARLASPRDIRAFADCTGDTNPIHLDEEYASQSIFGGCIAHGLWTASLISACFGTVFPGPGGVYVEQTLRFKGPVRIGDTAVATVRITGLLPEKHWAYFETEVHANDVLVLKGEAVLKVPSGL